MFRVIKQFFIKLFGLNPGFPLIKEQYWYCGVWYLYRSDLHSEGMPIEKIKEIKMPIKDKFVFNPFTCGIFEHESDEELYDGLIPCMQIGDKVGLYKITSGPYCENRFYDGLPWDDGNKINLILMDIISIDSYKKQQLKGANNEN